MRPSPCTPAGVGDATNAVAVPIYPDDLLPVRRHGPCRAPLHIGGTGQHLHPREQPDGGRAGTAVAALEGGVATLAVASGQAASAFAVQNLAHAGGTSSAAPTCMAVPGTSLPSTLKDQGIEVRFVDPSDPENFRRATDARTRAYYAETLPNPKLEVFPDRRGCRHRSPLGIPLIVDNTAAPLLLVKPFEHGAAVVVHSLTKYIGGHGTSGGIIIDGGNFDWAAHADRQPALHRPDPSYHGAVWSRGGQAARPHRLCAEGARHAAARPRRGDLALQCLPDTAGPGDAAAPFANTSAMPRKSQTSWPIDLA